MRRISQSRGLPALGNPACKQDDADCGDADAGEFFVFRLLPLAIYGDDDTADDEHQVE